MSSWEPPPQREPLGVVQEPAPVQVLASFPWPRVISAFLAAQQVVLRGVLRAYDITVKYTLPGPRLKCAKLGMMPRRTVNDAGATTFGSRGFSWVDVRSPSDETLEGLKRVFPFLADHDLQDCLPPLQRPKLIERSDYLFMVLLFPVFDRGTKAIHPTEVDVFVGKNFVITSHTGEHAALSALAERCRQDAAACFKEIGATPAEWLHALLHDLLFSCYPMLTHLSHDITAVEERVFEESSERTVREILRIKTNIVDFRKAMQGHKTVIKKLIGGGPKPFSSAKFATSYEDLLDHTKEIWDFLENDRETIAAIYDSSVSLMAMKTNEASKNLAALAFVIFPMTLVAAIFAMDAIHVPFRGWPGDFWLMLSVVFGVMLATVLFLRGRKWL